MLPEEEHEYRTGGYTRQWSTPLRRISWGAVIAGVVVTLGVFLMLQMLGAGIGLSTIDPASGETPSARALGIGAAIWWLIIGLISLFVGGWVAGRLGWLPHKVDRLLHGLTVWATFYAVMFFLVTTTMSAVLGGGLGLLGDTVSAAGQVAASPQAQQTAEQATEGRGLNLDTIRQEIAKAVGGGAQQGQQGNESLASAIDEYFKGPQTQQDRQRLAQQIAQTTGQSQAEADRMIARLEQQAEKAKETGEQVANVTDAPVVGEADVPMLHPLDLARSLVSEFRLE